MDRIVRPESAQIASPLALPLAFAGLLLGAAVCAAPAANEDA